MSGEWMEQGRHEPSCDTPAGPHCQTGKLWCIWSAPGPNAFKVWAGSYVPVHAWPWGCLRVSWTVQTLSPQRAVCPVPFVPKSCSPFLFPASLCAWETLCFPANMQDPPCLVGLLATLLSLWLLSIPSFSCAWHHGQGGQCQAPRERVGQGVGAVVECSCPTASSFYSCTEILAILLARFWPEGFWRCLQLGITKSSCLYQRHFVWSLCIALISFPEHPSWRASQRYMSH